VLWALSAATVPVARAEHLANWQTHFDPGASMKAVVVERDGLHSGAGTSAERLIELHGTNSLVECQTCGQRSDPQPHLDQFRQNRRPPVCGCGGLLKPATIMAPIESGMGTGSFRAVRACRSATKSSRPAAINTGIGPAKES
jgi:hypothetical protein